MAKCLLKTFLKGLATLMIIPVFMNILSYWPTTGETPYIFSNLFTSHTPPDGGQNALPDDRQEAPPGDAETDAPAWLLNECGWQYDNGDGTYLADEWKLIDNQWYHFDENGYMQTGWIEDNGRWYHLNGDGVMQTGWIEDNGHWYYLKDSGAMAVNETIDGYYLNADGVCIDG